MNDTEEHGSDHRKAPRSLTDADVQAAKAMATAAHLGQVDRAGFAYIEHTERVVGHLGAPTKEEVIVAWLHDIVEDKPTTLEDLEGTFGPLVAAAVDAVSHRHDETDLDYYARVKANPIALTVKAADLADNTDPARLELLEPDLRDRLEAKYAVARRALGIVEPQS